MRHQFLRCRQEDFNEKEIYLHRRTFLSLDIPLSQYRLWVTVGFCAAAAASSTDIPLSLSAATVADRATKIASVRRLRARRCSRQERHREGEIEEGKKKRTGETGGEILKKRYNNTAEWERNMKRDDKWTSCRCPACAQFTDDQHDRPQCYSMFRWPA